MLDKWREGWRVSWSFAFGRGRTMGVWRKIRGALKNENHDVVRDAIRAFRMHGE